MHVYLVVEVKLAVCFQYDNREADFKIIWSSRASKKTKRHAGFTASTSLSDRTDSTRGSQA